MDGLECCEVAYKRTLSETNYFRLEAEYYNAGTIAFSKLQKGENVTLYTQYGTSKFCDEECSDYPVLRLNELDNGFILEPQKFCHILTPGEFEDLRLKKGDVLIIRTNGNPSLVGRAAVVEEDTNIAFASYLFRVVLNGGINAETLVSFLNGKYGRIEIDKHSMKGNQTNFSPAKFLDITIPDFSLQLQKQIQICIKRAYELRKQSKTIYGEASQKLAGILHFLPNNHAISYSEKSFSASFGATGRLDAEYYQPKYDALFSLLSKLQTRPLGKIVTVKKSIEPGSEYYGDAGIPFIRVSDVSKFGIDTPSIRIPKTTVPSIESLYPKKDTILFSKDGSVGIAYQVEEDLEAVTSGALLHLAVKDTSEMLPEYLTLVLNSPIVQMQAERDASGAIIQHWKPSEIEAVQIPVLDMDIQQEIANKVQQSFSLRRQSEQLLENAKYAVELAIEQGEDKAMAWLQEQEE